MKAVAVDDIARKRQESSGNKINSLPFSLPLVSVIIVNYNYGCYLKQAADSVHEQTYPNIECIIVDNASTDESPGVLAAISKQYPGTALLRRSSNGGQTLASKEGFEASSGEYVVFLDADDFLLPSFIATHVFVHLSLRVPVGLTSADVIQAVDSRMVLGTFFSLSEYIRSGRGKRSDLFRRIDESAPETWPLSRPDAAIESRLHFVEPCDIGSYYWSPTSGNCYRRDALLLFLNNENLAHHNRSTDSYLILGISGLTGSVVIDQALAVYRLHGTNLFAQHPNLYCLLNYDRDSHADSKILSRTFLIDHLIANSTLFLQKIYHSSHYIILLKALDEASPRLQSTVAGCRSYLAGKLVSESAKFAREFGLFPFVLLLIRLKVTPHVILWACLRRKNKKRT
jgi:glycosyltransferase involved in cell wall biosynthesis